jgi:hypothetical protein
MIKRTKEDSDDNKGETKALIDEGLINLIRPVPIIKYKMVKVGTICASKSCCVNIIYHKRAEEDNDDNEGETRAQSIRD